LTEALNLAKEEKSISTGSLFNDAIWCYTHGHCNMQRKAPTLPLASDS